jgi:S-layer homology domain/Glucodextranase, domain B
MKKLILSFIIAMTVSSVGCLGVIYYDDPIAVGLGARPLGMGKAFVAVSDDVNAMFLNPAGLGSMKSWEMSTMSSNFLNEYQYTMYSGVTPTPVGVFGLGYVDSKITGISVSGGGTSDFYNQALVLSYGKDIGTIGPSNGNEPNIFAGGTLKYYSTGYTGDLNASDSGYNIDLGLKYTPAKWISYGLNFQNVLGGSKIYGDFESEDMPFITKAGVAFKWLEYNVLFALDEDMYLAGADIPWPMHFGAEWKIHPNLCIRAGYNQEGSSAIGGQLTNNTTFGLGFDYSGVKIDLAYMQNYAQTNMSSNIVSLSLYSNPVFGQFTNPVKEAPAPAAAPIKPAAQKLAITPSENMYTLSPEQVFSGTLDPSVTDIWIEGNKLAVSGSGAFEVTVPLNMGENEIQIRTRDTSSAETNIARKIVRFYVPVDLSINEVKNKDFAYMVIYTELYRYLGKDYKLNKPLSRELLALLLAKARHLDLSLPQKTPSKDVNSQYWAANYINAVESAGIMQNYVDSMFKPEKVVTKAEAALYVSKAASADETSLLEYLSGQSPEEPATMEDLSEMFYHSGILVRDMEEYRNFTGITP